MGMAVVVVGAGTEEAMEVVTAEATATTTVEEDMDHPAEVTEVAMVEAMVVEAAMADKEAMVADTVPTLVPPPVSRGSSEASSD